MIGEKQFSDALVWFVERVPHDVDVVKENDPHVEFTTTSHPDAALFSPLRRSGFILYSISHECEEKLYRYKAIRRSN